MKALMVSLALTLALNTCEKQSAENVQSSPAAVSGVVLPDTITLGEPIALTIMYGTPNPCWEFRRLEISHSNHTYIIKPIVEYDGRPCIQVLGSFTATSSVTPTERGIYTLRFWQRENQSLDKQVVVR